MKTEQGYPNARDIERAVVGAMLIEPERTIGRVASAGGRELFYVNEHRAIFEALDYMNEQGQRVDILTVEERLKASKKLKEAGGTVTLTGIFCETASAANIEGHLAILVDKMLRRKLLLIGSRIESLCYSPDFGTAAIMEEIMNHIAECREIENGKSQTQADMVRDWVLSSSGVFLTSDVYRDLALSSRADKQNCSKILSRLVDEGLIERYGMKRGQYRRIEGDCEKMNWLSADTGTIDFRWPGEIERYVEMMPGNIAVIAGEPNAGKTAFLLNTVRLNMERHEIHYFSSEMGASEMKKRLGRFDFPLDRWRFTPWERSAEFHDVVRPDAVNIIDYMEIHEDFYRLGGSIKRIFDRLRNGIAVIAIQKNRNTDIGRGGIATLEKPRLYLAMKPGEVSIVKGKNWAGDRNPNGLTSRFRLVNGARFLFDGWGVN